MAESVWSYHHLNNYPTAPISLIVSLSPHLQLWPLWTATNIAPTFRSSWKDDMLYKPVCFKHTDNFNLLLHVNSPWVGAGHHLEAGGVAEQLVQGADDARELGPQVPLLHPALQHQLMQHHGTVHGWGQPVVLLYCRHHLNRKSLLTRLRISSHAGSYARLYLDTVLLLPKC